MLTTDDNDTLYNRYCITHLLNEVVDTLGDVFSRQTLLLSTSYEITMHESGVVHDSCSLLTGFVVLHVQVRNVNIRDINRLANHVSFERLCFNVTYCRENFVAIYLGDHSRQTMSMLVFISPSDSSFLVHHSPCYYARQCLRHESVNASVLRRLERGFVVSGATYSVVAVRTVRPRDNGDNTADPVPTRRARIVGASFDENDGLRVVIRCPVDDVWHQVSYVDIDHRRMSFSRAYLFWRFGLAVWRRLDNLHARRLNDSFSILYVKPRSVVVVD